MTTTEIDRLICRSIVVVDSQGRERITLGMAGDCAEIQVHDGIEDTDNNTTSVSLFAEKGTADVYVSNGKRALRLDLDGLELDVFGNDDEYPQNDPTLTDLERRVIALMLDCGRLLKRLPTNDTKTNGLTDLESTGESAPVAERMSEHAEKQSCVRCGGFVRHERPPFGLMCASCVAVLQNDPAERRRFK